MKANTNTKESPRKRVAGILDALLADESALAARTFHGGWNATGPCANGLRKSFDAQYEELDANLDWVAPLMRVPGTHAAGTVAEFLELARRQEQLFLAAKMIAPIPQTYRGRIIELGTGSGLITLQLAARCPQARILGCEINPDCARDCRDTLSKAGHNGRLEVLPVSAENLLSEISRSGTEKPGFVISRIPLGNSDAEKADGLLDAIGQTLGDGGTYIQYQQSFLDPEKIKTRFPNTRAVPVFLNFPPALVYYAQK